MNVKRSVLRIALSAAGAALLLAGSANAQTPAKSAAPSGNAENGKKIFISYGCYECHGRMGQGGAGTGPRIGPPNLNYQGVLAYVRHPKGQMPPYTAKSASDQDIADIFAYLSSIPKPPDPKTIPLLNQ
jgi:mono/diheme cytochrome c family protein